MANVTRPADINAAFATAYNAGRAEGLLDLYEPGATVMDRHGAEHRGHGAILRELGGLLSLGGTMASTSRYAVVSGELALLSADWTIETRGPAGAPRTISGRSADVARRQPDGRWLYVLDHPFGA